VNLENERFLEEIDTDRSMLDRFWAEAFEYLRIKTGIPGDETEALQKGTRLIVIRSEKNGHAESLKRMSIISYNLTPNPKTGVSLKEEGGITINWPYSVNETYSLYGASPRWVEEITDTIMEAGMAEY